MFSFPNIMTDKEELQKISQLTVEQMQYEDALVMFHSVLEQYGCRTVLKDFKDAFPKMFEEMKVQIHRVQPTAALLR